MEASGWTSLSNLGSALASLMFLWAVVRQYFPFSPETLFKKHTHRLFRAFYPYVNITFPEYTGERMKRSEAYSAIQSYLSSTCTQSAAKLRADFFAKDSASLLLTMDDNEEVVDDFRGTKVWWSFASVAPRSQSISWYPTEDERRKYTLTFHKAHRNIVVSEYLPHVIAEGKAAEVRNRRRKLFTNSGGGSHGYRQKVWSHVTFEHPSTFDTLAMAPEKKREIMDDLDTFRKGKEYYAKVGKAWKRGYLLYGPPGTGKSTMVAAMANYLDYDVYDVELTTVKTNSDLRKLLIETTSKAIIVLEDIDCSLDLTGKRKKKKEEDESEDKKKLPLPDGDEKEEGSKVTLSGLLNFIDGLWSASAGERLIVFTTNHIEKLDPALIRRGRMDKHIEMSYCKFEAFKVLAKNYLGVDEHRFFETVRGLMEEVEITPADVAENLMPKSAHDVAETCLENLIEALNLAKEKASKQGVGGSEVVIAEVGEKLVEVGEKPVEDGEVVGAGGADESNVRIY